MENDNFQIDYLRLLQFHAEEEIDFLISNDHDSKEIKTPCMFCFERKSGKYACHRLSELRHFQSNILMNIEQKKQNNRRKAISEEEINLPTEF
jgi:hypothetical protein